MLEFGDFSSLVPEPQRRDLELLRELLGQRQVSERKAMERDLRSDRTRAILRDWVEFLERLPALPVDERPDAAAPIAALAPRRIARVYKQMVKMGRAIDDESPHEAL